MSAEPTRPRPPGGFVWDDRFLEYDFGPNHPFTQRSRRLAVHLLDESLRAAGNPPVNRPATVPVASEEYLRNFHLPEYLEHVREVSDSRAPGLLDRGDTPAFPGCYTASARLVAGAAWAIETALEHGRPTFHPAGGLHHAHPSRASGFCIFNDVAVAIGATIRAGRRVAYIDIDAHHGDGVMYGFYESGAVLDIDFHQDGRTLFPGTGFPQETGRGDGEGLKVNVPLPPGTGDATWVALFRRIVPPLLRSYRPDLIVLQHGADGHLDDPLTQLAYTSRGFDVVDRLVLDLGAELCGSRVVFTGGGGYRPESVARVFARAGIAVLGVALPAARDTLPEAWRREFEEEWGRAAPSTWIDPIPAGRARPSPRRDVETDLVRSLEQALGSSFPRTSAD
jgi:acetoin utilization protein AcuC